MQHVVDQNWPKLVRSGLHVGQHGLEREGLSCFTVKVLRIDT